MSTRKSTTTTTAAAANATATKVTATATTTAVVTEQSIDSKITTNEIVKSETKTVEDSVSPSKVTITTATTKNTVIADKTATATAKTSQSLTETVNNTENLEKTDSSETGVDKPPPSPPHHLTPPSSDNSVVAAVTDIATLASSTDSTSAAVLSSPSKVSCSAMGSATSNVAANLTSSSESEATTPTTTEAPKVDFKQKRVTRNSPLLLASPSTIGAAGKNKKPSQESPLTEIDSEPTTSGSEDKVVEAPIIVKKVRGRKPLKAIAAAAAATAAATGSASGTTLTAATAAADTSIAAAAKNRLTRKSAAAQDLAENTRMTRARRLSIAEVPQRRRGPPPRKISVAAEPAYKRKRSITPTKDSSYNNEKTIFPSLPGPSAKIMKIEAKDDSEIEELLPPPPVASANRVVSPFDICSVQLKQEMIESSSQSEESIGDNISGNTNDISRSSRLRIRKQPTTTQHSSPTTRSSAGRNIKVSSPSPSETKRRKLLLTPTISGSSTKRSSSLRPDEDSKDSMASSMDEIMLTCSDGGKTEKLVTELDDEDFQLLTEESEEILAEDKPIETLSNSEEPSLNGVEESILPDTPTAASSSSLETAIEVTENEIPSIITDEPSTSALCSVSDKSISLSPELVAEKGVNEICVKKFYKKSEFLENNLGIENDPKLSEIVQSASDENIDSKIVEKSEETDECLIDDSGILDEVNTSMESLKEGELRVEESPGFKKSPSVGHEDDDIENISPLIVEGDEEEEEEKIIAAILSKSSEVSEKVNDDEDVEEEEEGADNSETVSMENNPSTEDGELEDDICDEKVSSDGGGVGGGDVKEGQEETKEKETKKNASIEDSCNLKNKSNQEQKTTTIDDSGMKTDKKQSKSPMKIEIEDSELKEREEDGITEKENSKSKDLENELGSKIDENDDEKNVESFPKLELDDEENKTAKDEELNEDAMEEDVSDALPCLLDIEEEEKDNISDSSRNVSLNKEIMDVADDKKEIQAENEEIENSSSGLVEEEKVKIAETTSEDDKENIQMMTAVKKLDDSIEKSEQKVFEIPIASEIADGEEKSDNVKEEKKAVTNIKKSETKVKSLVNTSTGAKSIDSSKSKSNDETKISMKLLTSSKLVSSSATTTTPTTPESDEALRRKEQHLKNLGLLTHKAAEKHRLAVMQNATAITTTTTTATTTVAPASTSSSSKKNGNYGKGSISGSGTGTGTHEYTGTLKTVIKLNRNTTTTTTTTTTGNHNNGGSSGSGSSINNVGNRKNASHNTTKDGATRRQSLKMTFQKGRGRPANSDRALDNQSASDDSYYTIQNENEGAPKATTSATEPIASATVQTHGRKSYNRSNISTSTTIIDSSNHSENQDVSATSAAATTAAAATTTTASAATATSNKTNENKEILIPEKASSFKFHPGRLCQDQCFYCSGKFGLYDTPCHVAQIKSIERQQKILANEEKLTVDNCLCDACFRHVDRRANVPSYKKRTATSGPGLETSPAQAAAAAAAVAAVATVGVATTITKSSTNNNSNGAKKLIDDSGRSNDIGVEPIRQRKCLVPDCTNIAAHSLRRKCIRKSVKKFLLNFDMSTSGTYVSLCQTHYDAVIQCSGCVLCKRRLGKSHMYHITSDTDRLEKALAEMGIPVQLGLGTAVCKLCRYFANLLLKPLEIGKSQKAEFVKNYRKRLLQFHNIHEDNNASEEVDDDDDEDDEEDENSLDKKQKTTEEKINQLTTVTKSTPEKPKRKLRSLSLVSGNSAKEKSSSSNTCVNSNSNDSGRSDMPSPTVSTGSSVECIGEDDILQQDQQHNNRGAANKLTSISDAPSTSAAAAAAAAAAQAANVSAAAAAATTTASNQMILDNDVMVDYDVPIISSDSESSSSPSNSPNRKQINQQQQHQQQQQQQQQSKLKAILQNSRKSCDDDRNDISNVLRSNPNISMRELFPGEEDLGLQFKATFGSSNSQRTPEGWTRVQTFLQYDEPTRHLWEHLQKPYGNQSSFLRHLILLEKYYRNGDLILSQNASSNASVYAKTVRNRLTSYDSVCSSSIAPSPRKDSAENLTEELRSRSVSVDKIQRQLNSNAVTMIVRPKEPKEQQQQQKESKQKSLLTTAATAMTAGNSCQTNVVTPKNSSTIISNQEQQQQTPHNNSAGAIAAAAAAVAAAAASIPMTTTTATTNSRSILKTNLLGLKSSVEILPIASTLSSSSSSSSPSSSSSSSSSASSLSAAAVAGPNAHTNDSMTKQQKLLAAANKLVNKQQMESTIMQRKSLSASSVPIASTLATAAATMSATSATTIATAAAASSSGTTQQITSPPELISLTRQSSNASSLLAGNSNKNSLNHGGTSLLTSNHNKRTHSMSLKSSLSGQQQQQQHHGGSSKVIPPNVVILPDTLTPQERLQSKSWRPTLMPVTTNQAHLHQQGPLFQTADGRRLPALVQVQSGGRPFLISIHDYNRMCILRREKLMRDQMLKAGKNNNNNNNSNNNNNNNNKAGCIAGNSMQSQSSRHNSAQQSLSKAIASVMAGRSGKSLLPHQQYPGGGGAVNRQQQHLQSKNQFHPIAPKPLLSANQQQQQQQNSTVSISNPSMQPLNSILSNSAITSGSSSSASSSSSAVSIVPNFSGQMMPILTNAITGGSSGGGGAAAAGSTTSSLNTPTAAAAAANPTNSWLWNNFPDANQLLMNGSAGMTTKSQTNSNSMHSNNNNSNKSGNHHVSATITSKQHHQHHHHQQHQQQQLMLDNNLMSKIPKSLTVIPQHKLMPGKSSASALALSSSSSSSSAAGRNSNKLSMATVTTNSAHHE